MSTAIQSQPMPVESGAELNRQEISQLLLMWSVLAINVMIITFMNASIIHC